MTLYLIEDSLRQNGLIQIPLWQHQDLKDPMILQYCACIELPTGHLTTLDGSTVGPRQARQAM